MNRFKYASAALAAALTTIVPAGALAWHAGTHAYVADQLHKGGPVDGALLAARLYGANGPDLFNYVKQQPFLTAADYLHDYLGENAAERLWAAARNTGDPVLIAYAYGFAAHDNAFGADYTAHVDAVTGGLERGYVIEKAAQVAPFLVGLVPDALIPELSHTLVEFSVDVLVRQELDPDIGQKLLAATPSDGRFAALLVPAFAEPLGPYFGGTDVAAFWIAWWETAYRAGQPGVIPPIIPWYAQALAAPDPVDAVGTWIAEAASAVMGIPISPEQAKAMLWLGMETCRRDYQREVFATIGRVNAELSARGIFP